MDRFKPLIIGGGELEMRGETLRMTIPAVSARRYADAQIHDYYGLRRSRFPWRAPLRMTVRARMSHDSADGPDLFAAPAPRRGRSNLPDRVDGWSGMRGTAGFGFWNDPFTLTGGGIVSAPNVLWFFYASPPSNMALVEGVPGWGWKAAALNSARVPGVILAPAALAAVLLTKVPGLGRPVMAAARRAMRVSERLLPAPLTEWHTYQMEWGEREATFSVDGAEVLRAPDPPRGPLGFVAWVDNQYAVATPEGRFGFGLVEIEQPEWVELENLSIVPAGKEDAV